MTQTPLLSECKAREKASDTPAVKHFFAEWQKERGADPRLFGLMISTSGFTGTAMQWHAELDSTTKTQFSLLGPEQLLNHLVNVNLTLPPNAINRMLAERYPIGDLETAWLTYSRHGIAWVSVFTLDDGSRRYTVVDGHGQAVPTWKTKEIVTLLRKHLRNVEFFGLDVRHRLQRELLRDGPVSEEALASRLGESQADVDVALSLFAREGRIEKKDGHVSLMRDVVHLVNVGREFLDGPDALAFVSSGYAQEMLTSEPLMAYLESRYRVDMNPDERKSLSQLLRISPNALRYALFTDPSRYIHTYEHIGEIIIDPTEKAKWLEVHRKSLLQAVFFRAIHDLTSEAGDRSQHLAKLGIKRFRIRATLHAIGLQWEKMGISSELNIGIAVAGGAMGAGSLVAYSDPTEWIMWDGLLSLEAEEYATAEQLFQQALVEAENAQDREKQQMILNDLALVQMRQKQFDQAELLLANAFQIGEPDSPIIYTNRVICLMEMGRVEEAGKFVEQVVERFAEAADTEVIRRFREGWPTTTA